MILGLVLLLTSPIWGPLALLYHLARICGDGFLFVLEGYGVTAEVRSPLLRPLFYLIAVPLFPVVITLETALSVTLSLGAWALRLFRAGAESRAWLRLLSGVGAFALSPIWLPIVVLQWVIRRLVWEMGVIPVTRRLRRSRARTTTRGRFETFVALRYMRGRGATAGVSLVTGLSVIGVMFGVWALVVVLSVMAGFETELQEQILGSNAHVVALGRAGEIDDWELTSDKIRGVDGVKGVSPFIYAECVIRSAKGLNGAILQGIDPSTVGEVKDLAGSLVLGSQGQLKDPAEGEMLLESLDASGLAGDHGSDGERERADRPVILIGQGMQTLLGVSIGDVLQLVGPSTEPGPMGSMSARIVEFEVVGIFRTGMYVHDSKFTYVSLDSARHFLRMDSAVTGLEVAVHDVYAAPRLAREIELVLGSDFLTQDWQHLNQQLFAALKLEKVVMGVILTAIVAVASLNIISMLVMLVIEKRREIAILKAMGAGRFDLMKLFMVEGLLVGFIGTVFGLIFGLASCFALARWQFIELDSEVYYMDTLPVQVSAGLVVTVAAVAVGIAFLATLFPSWEGSSLDPVEGLRDA